MNGRFGLVALVAFSFSLVTADAGAQDEGFLGAEACGTCHQKEYEEWASSGHAQALTRLSAVQRRDRVCRSCHTMAPLSASAKLEGVQCESCHGAGQFYAPRNVMKDEELAKLLGLKKIGAGTCEVCHKRDGPAVSKFDFAVKVELVNHKTRAKAKTPEPPAAAGTEGPSAKSEGPTTAR